MASELEMKANLANNTSAGWDRFVRPHANIIAVPGVVINFGTRTTPVDGKPPTADSHGKNRKGVSTTFLSKAGLELPYYRESHDLSMDSALRRATRTLIGAVNNTLKPSGEAVAAQSPEYKNRRDLLVGSLFDSAFNILTLEDLSADDIAAMLSADVFEGPDALHSFLRGRHGLNQSQIAYTSDSLVLATADNIRKANREIAKHNTAA